MIIGSRKIKIFNQNNVVTQVRFSIIVPFRNEAKNLPDLLSSIENLDYPRDLFELILVNDNSNDVFQKIVDVFQYQANLNKGMKLNIRQLENQRKSQSPKKDAITTAIQANPFEWIFTTDADCVLHPEILNDLNAYIVQNKPNIIAGLVKMRTNSTILQQFQNWDWNSLLGFTLAGFGWKKPMICSGANLCYNKDIFQKINGFEGNNHIASGDDVFLLNKMYDYQPEKVGFLFHPEKVVITKSLNSWKKIIEQHKRWMSKTGSVNNFWLKLIGVIVWITNFWFVIGFLSLFFTLVFWKSVLLFLYSKILIDSIYLITINKKIKEKINFYTLIISNIIYPFFSILITFLWFFFGFNWKERKFRK